MTYDQIPVDFWPDELQQLLLKATIYQGKDCVDAWNHWTNLADTDHLDPGSLRLFPLLYKNLISNGIDHPLLTRLKGIYKKTWYKNQMLLYQVQHLLSVFDKAEINILLMKGMAHSLLYYKDLGVRPMHDFDVLIPIKHVPYAMNYLVKNGWKPVERPYLATTIPSDNYFRTLHSDGFANSNGEEVDLHWHVLAECCYDEADEFFWQGSVPLTKGDLNTRTLNSTDHLVHTCVHAFRWDTATVLRWIPDTMTILRTSAEQLDWDRVLWVAEEFRLVLQLRSAFNYLTDVFGASIPIEVHQKLEQLPVTRLELKENRIRTSNRLIVGNWIADYYRFRTYSRISKQKNGLLKLFYLPLFYKNIWGIRSWWRMPFVLLRKIISRSIIMITRKPRNAY
ncbi:MAG: nucleotidyltransferase family protein [Candidatus Neomarinimicrobiota bacterium]